MNKLIRVGLAFTLAACVVSESAWADLITIDPDGYAPATVLSNAVPGVGLSAFTGAGDGSYSFTHVYAGQDPACITNPFLCDAVTGSNGFSMRSDGFGGSRGWYEAGAAADCFTRVLSGLCPRESFSAMLVSFQTPTDYVEISGTFYSDWPIIWAFDSDRNRLGSTYSNTTINYREPTYNYNSATTQFQSSTSNVSYILAAGWSSNSSLDVLRYNDTATSVPEPGTAALFGLGLLVLGFAQRRKGSACKVTRKVI